MMHKGQCHLPLVGFFLLLTGCAINPVTGKHDFVLMSEQDEISLGARYHEEILQQYGAYDDNALQAYVNQIGQRLAQKSHRSALTFHFTVLDTPVINAFALPGGYVYITRGIMAYLNSEAELAGVLGHEIGHVTARHSVRQHGTATMTNVIGSILIYQAGAQSQDLVNILGTAIVRGYGREHELEADRLGAEYLARIGYDPEQMIDVVRVLKNQELYEKQRAEEEGRQANVYHGIFATHPDNDDRLQEVVRAANQYRSTQTIPENRTTYLKQIEGMVFGASEREGVIRDQMFYHKPLNVGIRAPETWAIENLPDRLIIHTKKQDALVQIMVDDMRDHPSARDYLLNRLHYLDIKQLENERPLKAAGLVGFTGITRDRTYFGNRKVRYSVWVVGNKAWLLAAATKNERDFEQFDPDFIRIQNSLHRLTAQERLLAQPLHIGLLTADSSTQYAQLAKNSPLQHHAEAQIRLLNAQYPTGKPQPWQPIKVIQ